jgi:D-glycero-D-manno-heptose 1,7-bisphosphate phosphatase
MSTAAIFLDKDGTLLDDAPYNVDPDAMKLAPGAREGLAIFADVGALIFLISNQGGVARGRFEIGALDDVEARLHELVASCGATLSGVYWCPHDTQGSVAPYNRACDCRKPAPGMLLSAAREHDLALDRSWFIGDILDDVEAGRRAGCRTVLIDNGNETVWRRGPLREPHVVAADMHRAALAIRESLANREAAR